MADHGILNKKQEQFLSIFMVFVVSTLGLFIVLIFLNIQFPIYIVIIFAIIVIIVYLTFYNKKRLIKKWMEHSNSTEMKPKVPEDQWGDYITKVDFTKFYQNGIFGEFTYYSQRIFGFEFIPYTDIEYICRFNFKYSPWSKKKGIHLETIDKKILNLFVEKTGTKDEEIQPIIDLLKKKTGSDWKRVYDNDHIISEGLDCLDYILEKKSGQVENKNK